MDRVPAAEDQGRAPKRAVVLLSGGLDSATCLATAKAQGFEVHALTIRYGQRHEREVEQAAAVAKAFGVTSHREVSLDLRAVGGSALTGDTAVPKDRALGGGGQDVPATYVPARNTVFLGVALGLAEVLGANDIFIGVNAVDYSGYPDCRPEFVDAFERLAQVATRAGAAGEAHFRIHAPLMKMSKAEIILYGASLGVDFGLTHSCYDPSPEGVACGRCDSCQLRRKGFSEAGVQDPARYAAP